MVETSSSYSFCISFDFFFALSLLTYKVGYPTLTQNRWSGSNSMTINYLERFLMSLCAIGWLTVLKPFGLAFFRGTVQSVLFYDASGLNVMGKDSRKNAALHWLFVPCTYRNPHVPIVCFPVLIHVVLLAPTLSLCCSSAATRSLSCSKVTV